MWRESNDLRHLSYTGFGPLAKSPAYCCACTVPPLHRGIRRLPASVRERYGARQRLHRRSKSPCPVSDDGNGGKCRRQYPPRFRSFIAPADPLPPSVQYMADFSNPADSSTLIEIRGSWCPAGTRSPRGKAAAAELLFKGVPRWRRTIK